jgi:acetyltransferase
MTIISLSASDIETHLAELVALLQNAVNGGAAVSFLAPLARETAEAFWRKGATQIADGTLYLLVAKEEERVAGCVQLALATQVNAPHRAEVQKMMVHQDFRQRGLARALMEAVEEQARQVGRTLLVLDTQEGSVAESFYPKMGYTRAGLIPNFALSSDGTYHATVLFYKWLMETGKA